MADHPTSAHETSRLDGPETMPSAQTGWWETERATFIRGRIGELATSGTRVIDVGCGRGTMLADDQLDGLRRFNVDSHVWDEWDVNGPMFFVCAEADALPFRDGVFDLVGSFDVLEHLPDDERAMSEQRRVAAPGGAVATAVPADRRLWSAHDEAVGHHRRYSTTTLTELADQSGLDVQRTTHLFGFLWLPARLLRSAPARRSEPGNSNTVLARTTRRVIGSLCGLERWWLGRRRLPFGTSLWAECRVRPATSRR